METQAVALHPIPSQAQPDAPHLSPTGKIATGLRWLVGPACDTQRDDVNGCEVCQYTVHRRRRRRCRNAFNSQTGADQRCRQTVSAVGVKLRTK